MCKQSAVGQRLQHLCSYSTYKHASDDEEGANRGRGLKPEHRESDGILFFYYSVCAESSRTLCTVRLKNKNSPVYLTYFLSKMSHTLNLRNNQQKAGRQGQKLDFLLDNLNFSFTLYKQQTH